MTRTEIDELIEYLEKNYHVDCMYIPADKDEYTMAELRIMPNLYFTFCEPLTKEKELAKEIIIRNLDKRDLIRF